MKIIDIKTTLENYPDVSFIDNLTIEELQEQMISDYLQELSKITGNQETLQPADPYRFILYACTLQIYQAFQYIERAGRQGLLKYSRGSFLESIGASKGIYRTQGTAATTDIRFMANITNQVILIPIGTRVTPGNGIYFRTTEAMTITQGNQFIDVSAQSTETGTEGNGYTAGQINQLVDPIPFILSASNTSTSVGGSGLESDESLAERIYLAPSSYTTAGPEDAYNYWTRAYNPDATDIKTTSPERGVVDIRFILQDGAIPSESILENTQKYLSDNSIRPMTDQVIVLAPDVINYDIDFTYYINSSDEIQAASIQNSAVQAVESYKRWQSEKIGRDINPDKLIYFLLQSGAKRVEIRSPVLEQVPDTGIAINQNQNIVFGGIEDD